MLVKYTKRGIKLPQVAPAYSFWGCKTSIQLQALIILKHTKSSLIGLTARSPVASISENVDGQMDLFVAAAWFVTSQKDGASALGLQNALGIQRYQTAWTCLHKLRSKAPNTICAIANPVSSSNLVFIVYLLFS